GQYAKVLIVPFGEYLPLRPLLSWTERLGMPDRDLLPGRDWKPLSWPGGKVGVSICYESAFGPVSRRMVDQGAGLLAVLTSDGWVGRTSAGYQHAAFAPLRAVECRRAVARAAATGVSQLIDPHGRVIGALPMFEKGVLLGRLPLRADRTFYSYVGDWPVGLSWGVLLAAAYRSRRKRISEPCFPAPQPA
ncbi:MAG: apolipoprotein N-acyltransferase, partial [Armatimonadetes bacterium]|nr:apolipoprotein N-acyltransferase [Armatimonadota bacterium]